MNTTREINTKDNLNSLPRSPLPRSPLPAADPRVEFIRLHGEKEGKALARRFSLAAKHFEQSNFRAACALLLSIARKVPQFADVRELYGLVLYRLGRYQDAMEELEAFRELSGSTEQHPVLADCHRALGRWDDVAELWHELGHASPSAELVTEGRIVFAGSFADQDDVQKAIRVLEKGWKPPLTPQLHHLRRAYALADLYERAGRNPRARELFCWIESQNDKLADVCDRVRALS